MIKKVKTNEGMQYTKLSPEEMKARGILGRLVGVCADFINPTRNGRKYSEELWENVFNNPLMQEKIKNKVVYGELGHPVDRKEIDPEKIAVVLSEQPKKNEKGQLCAVFDILDTPNGRILKTLCDYGSILGVSSRGEGDLITDADGNEAVDPDTYDCECWDIVLVPAVEAARMSYVTESLDNKNIKMKKALTESYEKASEEDKKVMKETLENLNIKLDEETHVCPKCGKEICECDKVVTEDTEEVVDTEAEEQEGEVFADGEMIGGEPETSEETPANISMEAEPVVFTSEEVKEVAEDAVEAVTGEEPTEEDKDKVEEVVAAAEEAKEESKEEQSVEEVPVETTELEVADVESEPVDESLFNKQLVGDVNINLDAHEFGGTGNNVDVMNTGLGTKDEGLLPDLGSLPMPKLPGLTEDAEDDVVEEPKEDIDSEEDFEADDTEEIEPELENNEDEIESDEEEDEIDDRTDEEVFMDYLLANFDEKQIEKACKALDIEVPEIEENPEDEEEDSEEKDSNDESHENIEEPEEATGEEDEEAIDDGAADLIKGLQEALKGKADLENSVKSLQEKLAVSDAKVNELTEASNNDKKAIARLATIVKSNKDLSKNVSALEESLKEKDAIISEQKSRIARLVESTKQNIQKATELNESVENSNKEKTTISESLTKANETIKALQEELKNKETSSLSKINELTEGLDKASALKESYKKLANKAVNKYIEVKANMLGLTSADIKRKLGESYKLEDVDAVYEDLRTYQLNVSRMPFYVDGNRKVTVKVNESVTNNNHSSYGDDDDVDDSLIRLANH